MGKLTAWLRGPESPSVESSESASANHLSLLLFALLLLGVTFALQTSDYTLQLGYRLLSAMLLVSLLISRTCYYPIAALIATIGLTLPPLLMLWSGDEFSAVLVTGLASWLLLPLLLVALWAPTWGLVLVATSNTLGLLLLPLGTLDCPLDCVLPATLQQLVAAALLLLGRLQRNQSHRRRQQLQSELQLAKLRSEETLNTQALFLANIQHEIRTPMNGVLGMLELLDNSPLQSRQQEYVRLATSSANRLFRTLNDILDLSRMEAGDTQLDLHVFNLAHMLEEVASQYAEPVQHKGVELNCYISPEVTPIVRGDPARLRQVLGNLLSNATKYTEQGSISVRLKVEGRSNQRQHLRIEVRDSGSGIPAKRLKDIFEPFFLADLSSTRSTSGIGLGLTIVKHLITLMGGEIGVESNPGVGSCFWIRLSLEERPGDQQPLNPALTSLRVLALSDQHDNLDILVDYLCSYGAQVTALRQSSRVLTELQRGEHKKSPYQLLLIDLKQGEIAGMDLAQQLFDAELDSPPGLVLLKPVKAELAQHELNHFEAVLNKPVRRSRIHDLLLQTALQIKLAPLPLASGISHTTRVLLADPDDSSRILSQTLLQDLGVEVDAVSNGEEVLDALQLHAYALLLMSCQMPQLNGFETTAEIRRLEQEGQRHRLPIIALTSNPRGDTLEHCREAGMDAHLLKPITREALQLCLNRWLNFGKGELLQLPQLTLKQSELDKSRMEQLEGLLGERFGAFVSAYLRGMWSSLERLQSSIDQQDLPATQDACHSIKSSALNLGANGLGRLGEELERQTSAGQFPLQEDLNQLTGLMLRIEHELSHQQPD